MANTHVLQTGDPSGAPVVFLNGAGVDLRIWEPLVARLPDGYHLIRLNLPASARSMGAMIRHVETTLDQMGVAGCALVGHSLGGMIAQGLAVKRLDLVRAMVLTGTAAKIDTPAIWQRRIDAMTRDGVEKHAGDITTQWMRRGDDTNRAALCDMLVANADGYLAAAHAISGTDFYTPTSGLGLSTLGIAGADDQTTPPDLQLETVDLIHGSRFELIRRAGHFAWLDQPDAFAELLGGFLDGIGHAIPDLT